MKSLKYLMMALLVLSITACNAQLKNQNTETVKIYGNCGMCKSTIEKAGNIKKQSVVDWNKETKIATILYDSLKTSKDEILKRIALAGYDSDSFLAPDDTYSNLPNCCQYERAKEVSSTMVMSTNNHSQHSNEMTEMQDENPLSAVFDNYFALKNSLVKTDGTTASTSAKNLSTALNEVKMANLSNEVHMVWMKILDNLKTDTQKISDTKETSQQRQYFNSLSKKMYDVIKISKQETPTYYQFCPMANDGKGANWLSKEETIKNPYYGSKMLSCGKTVETINK
ncbi:DUF3347 domain-containing protein [Cellulophaga baltica]|nr:DUF3347 domain-containing protein [Cellulophaga baltica]